MPQLVLDDTGIKVHLLDTKQDIQRSANQRHNNEEDDDVQIATGRAGVHDDRSAECT